MNILVTGANGFVGKPACEYFAVKGANVKAAILASEPVEPVYENNSIDLLKVNDFHSSEEWSSLMEGIDAVVHLAARVHIMNDTSSNPLEEFRKVNTEGTKVIFNEAVKKNIKKFIFISTIKVNGEETFPGKPFNSESGTNPQDPYSVSKSEAEQFLLKNSSSGTGVIILRPPLMYGRNVRGNFLSLLKLVSKRIPLPLKNTFNCRSLLYVKNLIDLMYHCAEKDAASGVYLVSDSTFSTGKIIETISSAMQKNSSLFSFPEFLFKTALSVIGKANIYNRLYGNLEIDSSETIEKLEWKPPFSYEEGFKDMAEWYLND
ncbi:MAG: NAD-dependent epimerase/dehydratase family protein [Planctomycetota bacterium]|jgi:nucleoside-diphosphate-sugar epimerase